MKLRTWAGLGLASATFGLLLLPDLWIWSRGRTGMEPRPVGAAPEYIVVPGASVLRSGALSPVLQERMDAALAALRAWPQARLLVSGTSIHRGYDETRAMRRYAIERGIDSLRIVSDRRGRSTLETVRNIRRFQRHPAPVVIASQAWHLPRCLWLARQQGLEVRGLVAGPPSGFLAQPREHGARILLFWQSRRAHS